MADDCGNPDDDGDCVPSLCATDIFQSQPALVLFAIATAVLSLGISVAGVMFVWLSFKYPNTASVLVPLIFVPLATLCVTHGEKVINGIKTLRTSTDRTGASSSCDPQFSDSGDTKLVDDKESARRDDTGK
jgi:hypothetical protein